ncbi:hypothetical protein [Lysobacter gummosus]
MPRPPFMTTLPVLNSRSVAPATGRVNAQRGKGTQMRLILWS